MWTSDRVYPPYGYVPLQVWGCTDSGINSWTSAENKLSFCRWIFLLPCYVRSPNQYSSVHCEVAALLLFDFFSCRESIVCAGFLHKNSKFYEMHFPQAPRSRICSVIRDQCVLIACCRLLPVKLFWQCDTSKKLLFYFASFYFRAVKQLQHLRIKHDRWLKYVTGHKILIVHVTC